MVNRNKVIYGLIIVTICVINVAQSEVQQTDVKKLSWKERMTILAKAVSSLKNKIAID
jgi:uncharacterized membrane protein (DUF441 family)